MPNFIKLEDNFIEKANNYIINDINYSLWTNYFVGKDFAANAKISFTDLELWYQFINEYKDIINEFREERYK